MLRRAVAQWLEQGTHNPSVVGSIPTGPTRKNAYFRKHQLLLPCYSNPRAHQMLLIVTSSTLSRFACIYELVRLEQ